MSYLAKAIAEKVKLKNENRVLIADLKLARRQSSQAHKAIFEVVKNIETVRYLADHDMPALRGLGCLPIAVIPNDVNKDSWESLMTFRNAIIN